MAEDTTPKTTQATDNSKPISAMPELTTAQGSTLVPVVDGGNKKVKLSTIKSYINEGMVAQQTGKGLSTNDFTNVLKAKLDSLSNYDDAQLRQAVNALQGEIDTILGDGATSAIDTFNEIEAFLTGITDTQTLTGLLQQLKSTITGETDGKLANKVDKVSGKGLSANDYTNEEKAAVATIANKVDKVDGKGLSANDYTDDDKAKLGALPTNAELDSSLGAKLDKSVWDEEHGQFGLAGYITTVYALNPNTNYRRSGMLPLDRNSDIVAVVAGTNIASVALYDATGKGLAYKTASYDSGVSTITWPSAQFPKNAVYFQVSTIAAQIDNSKYTNGPTQESREGAVSEAIQASKLALFIDQWNAACGSDGKYDPANAPDPQHPFFLNTLWLTYKDAARVLRNIQRPPYNVFAAKNDIPYLKTNIFTGTGMSSSADNPIRLNVVFADWVSVEVVNVSNGSQTYAPLFDGISTFRRCAKLREIIGPFTITKEITTYGQNFEQCAALVDMKLHRLAVSIYLADSPLLSLSTMQYMVSNAANATEITVTVHPDVYAKLSGDTTNAAAAALTADELTAWQAVMTSAAARNIAFATTE